MSVGEKETRISDMPLEQQIERLIRQRNELCRLIDRFALENGDDGDGDDDNDGLRDGDDDVDDVSVEMDKEEDEIVIRVPNPLRTLGNLRRSAGKLWDLRREITRDMYQLEDVDPATGEMGDDDRSLYARVAKEMGPWLL